MTLDADSYLYRDALRNLVERYLNDPPNTRAVAGTMLVRNSRKNWVTKAQEWDYFHGIAAIKRVQSLYQGTLVAQGAFSLYERATLREVGGWADCVGEDIVLTWAMLRKGWRVGHAEDALCFTNAPDNLHQFVRQRQRWARGMMEAFRQFPDILFKPRLSTMFVWWNLLFPWLDLAYTLFFIPGIVLALFGIYWIAGPLTLALLPMALGINYMMYRVGSQMFTANGLQRAPQRFGFPRLRVRVQPDPATRVRRGLLLRDSRPAQELGHEVIRRETINGTDTHPARMAEIRRGRVDGHHGRRVACKRQPLDRRRRYARLRLSRDRRHANRAVSQTGSLHGGASYDPAGGDDGDQRESRPTTRLRGPRRLAARTCSARWISPSIATGTMHPRAHGRPERERGICRRFRHPGYRDVRKAPRSRTCT